MKPRQREQQKQSSRMYLRKHDHRDVIYQDMYHNAMWCKTEDIDDELVWVKYPKHALLTTYGGSSSQSGAACWMDLDRQFQYGVPWGGGGRGRPNVWALECGLTVYFSTYGNDCNWFFTEDGIRWQQVDKRYYFPNGYLQRVNHFGEDGLCWYVEGATQYDEPYPYRAGFTFYTWIFSKDEESGLWDVELNTYSYTDKVNALEFICNTQQGCIMYTTYGAPYDSGGTMGANNVSYWHIDHAGVKTLKDYTLWQTNPIWADLCYSINVKPSAYAKVGNRCFCIVAVENMVNRYYTDRYERIYLLSSNDQGATWTGEKVFEAYRNSSGTPLQARVNMYVRDGEVFAIYATNKTDGWKVHILSTYTGTQWDEISLPTWLDVPVIQGGGICVNPTPSVNTLKIAVDPQNTTGQDINLASMIGDAYIDSNLKGCSILFVDGEQAKITDEEVYFVFGSPYLNGWMAYFDNRYLAENSKAFAWQVAYSRDTDEIPDTVIPYDYVLG